MSEVAQAVMPSQEEQTIFRGTPKNLAIGIIMLVAAAMSFMMGMTEVYFARALAWTFVIWGALMLYVDLWDNFQVFEVTDEALLIHNNMRFWNITREWKWENINRLDVIVKKVDARPQDVSIEFRTFNAEESATLVDEHSFDPRLTEIMIERSGLNPDKDNPVTDLYNLPSGVKGRYTWA